MRYSDSSAVKSVHIKNAVKPNKKIELSQILLYCIVGFFAFICLLSFVLVVIVAFSSEDSIRTKGFSFFPLQWSLESFKYVGTFKNQLLNSYIITIIVTVSGTFLSLILTSMLAYTLSKKDFALAKHMTIFVLITMLFSGGLLSEFLVKSNMYMLRNNLLVLIIPGCVTAWNTIIMRTFIVSNVPTSLSEAAKIDGAGEVYTFFKVILPIIKPVLAAIGFMVAVAHWNEWQDAFLYIDNPNVAPLQLMLIRIEKNLDFLHQNLSNLSVSEMETLKNSPTESTRMAILLCVIGPVIVIYPFFQKYFIKGIAIGSVKG